MNLPNWAVVGLQVVFFAIIILVVYKQLKERFLYKYNPNKWLVLAAAGLVFFIPIFTKEYYNYDMMKTLWQYLDSTIFIILFVWFIDLANGSMKRFRDSKNNVSKVEHNLEARKQTASAKKNKKLKNRDSRRRK